MISKDDFAENPVSIMPKFQESRVISRVMSRMIICLDRPLPDGSSDLPGADGPPYAPLRSCFGRGLHGPARYRTGGSLLHCPSNLACVKRVSGIFLLHYPRSHLHRTLSGVLPYEARTFLTCFSAAAIIRPTFSRLSYYHSFPSFSIIN